MMICKFCKQTFVLDAVDGLAPSMESPLQRMFYEHIQRQHPEEWSKFLAMRQEHTGRLQSLERVAQEGMRGYHERKEY